MSEQVTELNHGAMRVDTLEQVIEEYAPGRSFLLHDYPPEETEQAYAIVHGEAIRVTQAYGTVITVAGYAVHPATKRTPNGDMLLPRLIISALDGKIYHCFSVYGLRNWKDLVRSVENSGGVRGRKVRFRGAKTSAGLEPIPEFDLLPREEVRHGKVKERA